VLSKLSLAIELAGLRLNTPFMNAAGVLGTSMEILRRVHMAGAGAVVTKSIGPKPREGHKNPTLISLEFGVLNAMGLPNPGSKYFFKEFSETDFPVIASFFGSTLDDFVEVAKMLTKAGVSALELNCSCPNVIEEMGMLAADSRNVGHVTAAVKQATSLPVFVKLSPSVTDIVEIAEAAQEAGADAITATNTLRSIVINVDLKRPILTNVTGGLSGSALKPVSLRCVWEIYENVEIPIIGCGGVENWRDALEYFLAGASAVQVGTAFMTRGFSVFNELADGIAEYMKKNGYSRIKELVGLAHEF
jgi:dihydroorotate dehydrogenase (NAD+) catalytic subunit